MQQLLLSIIIPIYYNEKQTIYETLQKLRQFIVENKTLPNAKTITINSFYTDD